MTAFELITKHYNDLRNTMRKCYMDALESGGEYEYKVYIWEDGEIETHETTGNTWLQSRTDFELYYVATVRSGMFDWRDEVVDSLDGMSEDELDDLRDEIISNVADGYDPDDALDRRLYELRYDD